MSCLVTIWSQMTSDQITDLKFNSSECMSPHLPCFLCFFGKLWCLSQIAYFQIRNNTRSLPQGNSRDELLEMTGIEVWLQSPVATREGTSDRRALRWEGCSVRPGLSQLCSATSQPRDSGHIA